MSDLAQNFSAQNAGRRVVQYIPDSLRARLVVAIIRSAGALTRGMGHRGLWRVARLAGSFAPKDQLCAVQLETGGWFQFEASDPYWSRMVCSSYCYEPEIAYSLRLFAPLEPIFIDCGANFGYWSVYLAGEIDPNNIVAIEASPSTFQHLTANWKRDGERFSVVNRAIFSSDGLNVALSEINADHASTQISPSQDGTVQTITIDTILADHFGRSTNPVIVKLDVEGVEIQALLGARDLLSRGSLLIYEDHGNDASSSVTEHIIEVMGWPVFYINGPRVTKILRSKDASDLKRDRKRGYNFLAASPDSVFHSALLALASR